MTRASCRHSFYARAREWHQKEGADAGNADAMNNLGALYQNSWGVARNQAKAQAWYRKAAFTSAEAIVEMNHPAGV